MGIDKTYKLYVFDLDGTLVDTRTDIARALETVLSGAGYDVPTREQVISVIGGGSENAVRKLTGLTGKALMPHLSKFMALYEELCSDNTRVYDGGIALLERLKAQNAVLALVTMKSKAPTYKIMQRHGLSMFDEVITFDDVERRKPDPDSLNKIMQKYDIQSNDALMIGDTVTDMRYAKAAGIDACAMLYGYGVTNEVLAENPQYALSSFLEF
jgi:phosphoglycolate phosphatase